MIGILIYIWFNDGLNIAYACGHEDTISKIDQRKDLVSYFVEQLEIAKEELDEARKVSNNPRYIEEFVKAVKEWETNINSELRQIDFLENKLNNNDVSVQESSTSNAKRAAEDLLENNRVQKK